MKVKEHYDNHLADFYSWMMGDFETKKEEFKSFCLEHDLLPHFNKQAFDLGAGNGIQTIALAELGFRVLAVDFNEQLLNELHSKKSNYPIQVLNADLRNVSVLSEEKTELIICCGDTLSHLESFEDAENLIFNIHDKLEIGGSVVLSFRDYEMALEDTFRFIPVKSDETRILTCFLDYLPDKVRVTDLLHQKTDSKWVQKVSSYYKIRLTRALVISFMEKAGFTISTDKTINRLITIIGTKQG